MSNIQNYLQELAGTIGPRPVASDTERTAAEWIASAFHGIGLPAEIQDFETNRTTTWSNFMYYLIAILCVLVIGLAKNTAWLAWFLFIVLIVDAVGYFIELNGGRLLSRVLSKGPSQNVIARYTPRTRPGEARRKKVVIVAHYDTLRVSPLTENALAKVYGILSLIAKYLFIALPVLCFLMVLPFKFLKTAHAGIWYVSLVLCIVPLILMLDLLIRGIFKRFSQGANNNASGVAAMLDAAAQLTEGKVDLSENLKQHTQTMRPVQDSFFGDNESGALWMPSDELGGDAASGSSDFPDDFSWAPAREQAADGASDGQTFVPAAPAPVSSPTKREAGQTDFLQFETMDFGVLPQEAVSQPTISFAPVGDERDAFAEEDPSEVLGPDLVGAVETQSRFHDFERKTTIFDRIKLGKKKKKGRHAEGGAYSEDSSDWLGLDDNFDARSAGKEIGSWDNFDNGEDGDDDGFAWKGGAAGGDILDDYNFAAESAARIRRKFSESFESASIDEKEFWFVATGAFGVHGTGMKRFLEAYGSDLRDAFIINVECVGAGQLRWYSEEGAGKSYSANVRMTSLARRATRNLEIRAKAARAKGVSTDATVALRDGLRAITITRLGKDGEPVNWRSMNDTLQDVDPELVAEAARFVAGMAREA